MLRRNGKVRRWHNANKNDFRFSQSLEDGEAPAEPPASPPPPQAKPATLADVNTDSSEESGSYVSRGES